MKINIFSSTFAIVGEIGSPDYANKLASDVAKFVSVLPSAERKKTKIQWLQSTSFSEGSRNGLITLTAIVTRP